MKPFIAALGAILGILLLLGGLLIPVSALLAGELGKSPVAVTVAIVFLIGVLGGGLLIRVAARTLRASRIFQIGLGMFLAVGLSLLGWLQQAGMFERSEVSLEDGVLLIRGPLSMATLEQFRRIEASNDLRNVRVRLRSSGGITYVGMAIGREIHRLQLDVEVDKRCISSCANYLFTAGRAKHLQSPEQVQFHGGALQPNFVTNALERIKQGRQMTSGEDMPADLDVHRFRELIGLAEDFPFNSVSAILAEKAFFEEIGVSPLTPVFGQYGDYSAWFNDGVHDNYSYLPEDYALLGVTNVIVAEPGSGGFGSKVFRARTSVSRIEALRKDIAVLYSQIEAAMPIGPSEIWRKLDGKDAGTRQVIAL